MQTVDPIALSNEGAPAPSFGSLAILSLLRDGHRFILQGSLTTGLVLLAVIFLFRDTFKASAIVLPPDKNTSTLAMFGWASSPDQSLISPSVTGTLNAL